MVSHPAFRTSFIIFVTFILFTLIGCNDNVTENEDNIEYEPLIDIQISEGNTWQVSSALPDTGNSIYINYSQDITFDDLNNIYVTTDFAGIFKSTDDGKIWAYQNNGIAVLEVLNNKNLFGIRAIEYYEGLLFAYSQSINESNIYISNNNAESWNKSFELTPTDSYSFINCFAPKNKGELYAGAYKSLLYTNNLGETWHNITVDQSWGNILDIEFVSKEEFLIATSAGIFSSKNSGQTWGALYLAENICHNIEVDTAGIIYINLGTKILSSRDDGQSWEVKLELDDQLSITDLMVNKNGTIFVCHYTGLNRSKDNGTTWQIIGPSDMNPKKIMYDKLGRLVVLAHRKVIYISPS